MSLILLSGFAPSQALLSLLAKQWRFKSYPLPTAMHDVRDVWSWEAGYCDPTFEWPLPNYRPSIRTPAYPTGVYITHYKVTKTLHNTPQTHLAPIKSLCAHAFKFPFTPPHTCIHPSHLPVHARRLHLTLHGNTLLQSKPTPLALQGRTRPCTLAVARSHPPVHRIGG